MKDTLYSRAIEAQRLRLSEGIAAVQAATDQYFIHSENIKNRQLGLTTNNLRSQQRRLAVPNMSGKNLKDKVTGWVNSEISGVKESCIAESKLAAFDVVTSSAAYQTLTAKVSGWKSYSPRSNCATLSTNLASFQDNVQTLVYDNQDRLNAAGESVLARIEDAETLKEKLKLIEDITGAMKLVVTVLQNIPYVGGIIKLFFTALEKIVSLSVTPSYNAISNVLAKIASFKVEESISKILSNNDLVAEKIMLVVKQNDKAHSIIVADVACPSFVEAVTQPSCASLATTYAQVNSVMSSIITPMNSYNSFLTNELLPPLSQSTDFLNSALWKTTDKILKLVTPALTLLNNFLSTRYSFCIPAVCYRKETSCSNYDYPCGTFIVETTII